MKTFGKAAIFAAWLVGFLALAPAEAREATLTWDPSPSLYVMGYRVHYGTAPGDYAAVVDVGDWTSCVIEDAAFSEGGVFYFAVVAYDVENRQSGFSNEVSWTFDPPEPPAEGEPDPAIPEPPDPPPDEEPVPEEPAPEPPPAEEPAPEPPPAEEPAPEPPPAEEPAPEPPPAEPSPDGGGEAVDEPSECESGDLAAILEALRQNEAFMELLQRLFPTIDFKEL
jgi:hypothetical protein